MRKLHFLLLFLFAFSVLSAQEKLSKEEKARREKNIQAGNPFAKYGYKAKVATLSKGKYLEFHDLDSIVTIGTSRWHVDNKKIVGDIVIDSLNVDAQPIGDAPGMWMSPDPLSEEFPSYSPYSYCFNNPLKFVDPDGREPIKPQAGTSQGFVAFLNNTRSKMGTLTGNNAHNAMMRLGKTEMNWSHMRPEPMTTNPFNTSKDKYIYTERVGWFDMSHFMFYAGRAYDNKMKKEGAQAVMESEGYKHMESGTQMGIMKVAYMDPVGEAVQDGYRQEMTDRVVAGHSAYSYEDLPSDKWGADFGANYFNPNSEMTLGEQLQNYLNTMGATKPQNAPNYSTLPTTDANLSEPTRTNHTTEGVFTKSNP
ncbi:hypothetical protein SL053_002271 [Flavobacterium psychrophilum]|nr:hypothetical protein [Flavobacterium psychrophilum]ELM3645199.1 hypothetical protein [Flavobacterium psychrophilum]ELV7526174.1 hypothetical protein [Flavobacterium psychrophilum]ELY2018350.1 hypothetical protein [Flavobacterium psychrophilum]